MFSQKLNSDQFYYKFLLFLLVGLIIRIIINHIASYSFDFHAFVMWSRYLTTHSIAELFEYLPEGYTPYPPFYYYVLKIIGLIIDYLHLWEFNRLSYFIIKTPVFLADIIVTWLIYKFTQEYISKRHAFVNSMFYYLHPAIIYNTSVWGQIDSIIILLTLLAIILLIENKLLLGTGIYLLSVLTKLQSLALIPLIVLLTSIKYSIRKLTQNGIILGILSVLPFLPIYLTKGFKWTWDYFFTIPNWYAYSSIYTVNLWAPLGFIVSDNNKLLNLIEIKYIGIGLFWFVGFLILFPLMKNKKNLSASNILFAAFLLWYDFSFFATRIHSRYLIYSFGFFAPFFTRFPLLGILLSILMFVNFLLPNKNPLLFGLVTFLNHPITIIFMVIFAFILFLMYYWAYLQIVSDTKIRRQST